jgi:hypothetical protein
VGIVPQNCKAVLLYGPSIAPESGAKATIIKEDQKVSTERAQHDPVIIPRPDHNVSRQQISPSALKVLYRLSNAGYQAYLVGGGVRDLLLGREPKDFDVATDAPAVASCSTSSRPIPDPPPVTTASRPSKESTVFPPG